MVTGTEIIYRKWCFCVEVMKGRFVVTCICQPNISQNHLRNKSLVTSVRNSLESIIWVTKMHSVFLLQYKEERTLSTVPSPCMLLDCGCNVTAASDCCCHIFPSMTDCTKLNILCSLKYLCLGSVLQQRDNNAKVSCSSYSGHINWPPQFKNRSILRVTQ